MLWTTFGDQWELNHPVTFDGVNRLIIIAPDAEEINVKVDIYSNWKEWVQLYDNAKYPAAIRTTGGDPIGGGTYTGDVYFLLNNWRIRIDHSCVIDGVVYSDNFPSPFVQVEGTQIVTNKVSSISTVISPTISVDGLEVPTVQQIRQEMDTNSAKLTSILTGVGAAATGAQVTALGTEIDNLPSAVDIRSEIDASSTRLASLQADLDSLQTDVANLQSDYNGPSLNDIAAAVKAEIETELNHLMTLQNGLTSGQATMLLEMFQLLGLDPTKPLVVTTTSRSVGTIVQDIDTDNNSTVVTRTS